MKQVTNHSAQIESQSNFHSLLENFGVTYQKSIGMESENTYAKENSSFGVTTVLAFDVDLAGVFEGKDKIQGMSIENSKRDNGFETQSYPVIIVTFNN